MSQNKWARSWQICSWWQKLKQDIARQKSSLEATRDMVDPDSWRQQTAPRRCAAELDWLRWASANSSVYSSKKRRLLKEASAPGRDVWTSLRSCSNSWKTKVGCWPLGISQIRILHISSNRSRWGFICQIGGIKGKEEGKEQQMFTEYEHIIC